MYVRHHNIPTEPDLGAPTSASAEAGVSQKDDLRVQVGKRMTSVQGHRSAQQFGTSPAATSVAITTGDRRPSIVERA